ncbi:hypothetical protein D3C80_1109750 [compost metagenome]
MNIFSESSGIGGRYDADRIAEAGQRKISAFKEVIVFKPAFGWGITVIHKSQLLLLYWFAGHAQVIGLIRFYCSGTVYKFGITITTADLGKADIITGIQAFHHLAGLGITGYIFWKDTGIKAGEPGYEGFGFAFRQQARGFARNVFVRHLINIVQVFELVISQQGVVVQVLLVLLHQFFISSYFFFQCLDLVIVFHGLCISLCGFGLQGLCLSLGCGKGIITGGQLLCTVDSFCFQLDDLFFCPGFKIGFVIYRWVEVVYPGFFL